MRRILVALGLLGCVGACATAPPPAPVVMPAIVAPQPVTPTPVALPPATARPQPPLTRPETAERKSLPTVKETVDTAKVIALILAASRAAYHARGRPCACPDDTMRNGRRCGGNSAYSRPGGARPLCYPTDVSPDMLARYRSTGSAVAATLGR